MSGLGEWDDEEETSWPTADGDSEASTSDVGIETPEPGPQLVYGNVSEFVDQFLRHAYRRKTSGRLAPWWSGEWWKHDEAVMRLEALWRAWEHLRLDPATGMSVWWRDHADHHMRVLMADDGPFHGSPDAIDYGKPLTHVEPPEGLFVDERVTPTA
ncbi:DUF4913 domain-containing protein [Microbacterium paludicola]|uniref:DUF4913 domain-containing protein n=1 Tax=Microbacterium paludicola TaxID=300019 RepID=UPI0011A13E4C|nr:DUF4913 domain-containing protein [Microbacterium paludicola]